MRKQTNSKPPSKPKATPSQSPPSHCLSGLLLAVSNGDMTRAQAHEIASRWRKESERRSSQ